jgi:hypothetical protein
MPGSAAETLYGRRGGGWAPAPAREPVAPLPVPVDDRCTAPDCDARAKGVGVFCALHDTVCRDCDARYGAHTGDLCPVCRRPVEHHAAGELDAEWAGRARMARARAAALDEAGHRGSVNGAGILAPLDAVDLEALARVAA